MNLTKAEEGKQYTIARIETEDEELDSFLFSLGCYSGEPITVISRWRLSCTIAVRTEDTASTTSWQRRSSSECPKENPPDSLYPSVSNR